MFLLPAGTHLQDCMMSQCRRPLCEHSLLWKPENLQYTFDLPDTIVCHACSLAESWIQFLQNCLLIIPSKEKSKTGIIFYLLMSEWIKQNHAQISFELILLLVSIVVLRVKQYSPRYWSCGIHGRLVWYWWWAHVS
jgi:hypothetical protein